VTASKPLPHSVEAEEAVLGTAMLDPAALAVTLDALAEEDFYRPAHRTVFRAVAALQQRGQPVEAVAVSTELGPDALAEVGGAPFLHTLVEAVPTPANAGSYAATVAELARQRRLIDAGVQIAQLAWEARDSGLAAELAAKVLEGAAVVRGPDAFSARLLDVAALDALPDPSYLVDGIIPDHSIVGIVGAPGSGKTFLACEITLRVAAGLDWLDHEVRQGGALYVTAEDPQGFKVRSKAWRMGNRVLDGQLDGLRVHPDAVNLFTLGRDFADLLGWCRQHRPALVVFDTLARCSVGADENSAKDMGVAIDNAERLRAASGGTVIFVHHTPRNGTNPRGSTALEGAAERIINVERSEDRITVRCSNERPPKNAAPFPPIYLSLHVVEETGSCVLRRLSGTLQERDDRSHSERILAVLSHDVGALGLRLDDVAEQANVPRSSTHRHLSRLVSGGVVTKRSHRFYLTQHAEEDG
jgi:hypothetical protein